MPDEHDFSDDDPTIPDGASTDAIFLSRAGKELVECGEHLGRFSARHDSLPAAERAAKWDVIVDAGRLLRDHIDDMVRYAKGRAAAERKAAR